MSTASDRSSCLSLSLTLTDAETPGAASAMEESFDFNDELDNVFLRGSGAHVRVGLAIGARGLAMRDHPKMFTVAYEDLEIGAVIGKGATGAVLEAVHKPTGTRLALKVINMFDKSRRSQLIREICTLYDAACPSLISFYGAFYREGCITLALEMMDGGALANLIAQLGPIPERALANMVFQILWALAYLKHDKRVHRDIKPSNLLINSHGEVKVSDFGLSAELQSSLAMCGTFVGTFKYMSPERIRNQPYDYASDVWSLGLTLIECATGRYPYQPGAGEDEEDEEEGGMGGDPAMAAAAAAAAAAATTPSNKARNKNGSRRSSCIDMIQAITESDPPTLPAGGRFSPEFHAFLENLLQKDPRRRLPPEILLGAPWLRMSGAVSLAAAVKNTRHWIHHEAVPGRRGEGEEERRDGAAGGSGGGGGGGGREERREGGGGGRGGRLGGRSSSSSSSSSSSRASSRNNGPAAAPAAAAGATNHAPMGTGHVPAACSMPPVAMAVLSSFSSAVPTLLSSLSSSSLRLGMGSGGGGGGGGGGGRVSGLAPPLPLRVRSTSSLTPSSSSPSSSSSHHYQRHDAPPMRSFST